MCGESPGYRIHAAEEIHLVHSRSVDEKVKAEQASVFRLPETGIFYHAQHNDDIELEKSWVIGDSTLELAAAWRAGMRYIGVRTGEAVRDKKLDVDPDLIVTDLPAALASLARAQAEAA